MTFLAVCIVFSLIILWGWLAWEFQHSIELSVEDEIALDAQVFQCYDVTAENLK